MVKFTKILALASSAVVFTGMAYGQAICAATALNNVQIRGESTNDIVGDLRIKCTNTPATLTSGTLNVQLFATTGVTFTSKVVDTANGYSEATAYANPTKNADVTPALYNAANAVLGQISPSANSIIFTGIPVPALAAGVAGDFFSVMVTNVRVNASALAVSTGAPTTVSLTAVVYGTPVSQLSIAAQQVAYIQNALGGATSYTDIAKTASTAGTANNFVVCSAPATTAAAGVAGSNGALMYVVKVSENFPSAFRSAALEQSPLQFGAAPGVAAPTANNPVAVVAAGANAASSNTRLKITFSGVPSGVSLYTTQGAITSSTPGAPAVATAKVQFTTAETGTFAAGTTVKLNGNDGYVAIPVSSNTATAVYDVTSNDAANLDTFDLPIYVQFTAGLPISTTPITATVSLAPTGSATSIPNFNAAAGSSVKLTGSTFNACSTSLLFPFVTNQLGFDTGIAISNTSADPFGTKGAAAQAGTCTLSFYGATPNPPAFSTANVPAGTVTTLVLSGAASGFQGYAIAQCNFQYAHGFAFITNGSSSSNAVAQGYLAGVIPDTNQTNRVANPAGAAINAGKGESLGN